MAEIVSNTELRDSHGEILSEKVIEVRNVYKSFGENHVLQGFDLALNKGENLIVLGRSGSGKSVLLKCIVGLITPDSGFVSVFGKEITTLTQRELDYLRSKIGFVFQYAALYDSMTVRENLAFPMRMHLKDQSKQAVEKLIRESLDSVGLEHAIDLMPSELSGGMKKRIGLARALILKPEIILYDEPTAGLDPQTAKEISNLIVDVQEAHQASALIITHDLVCAKITANRIILLVDGVSYAEGSFDELDQNPDEKVKGFFD